MRTALMQTTDHGEIRKWANHFLAVPYLDKSGEKPVLRIGFPGSKKESPVLVSWGEWFARFEEAKLALQYRNETGQGESFPWYQLIPRPEDGIDPHLQTPAEANREKHINFLEEEEKAGGLSDLPGRSFYLRR